MPDERTAAPAKRVIDLIGASALLLLLAPLLLTLGAAIAATSRGPAVTRRERLGLGGTPFAMFTFQTAPSTAWGRRLRHHFLDQLPQLINVIRGEMSLVGPRPLPPEKAAGAPDRARMAVRPGITGLWQIGGRSGLPWEEMAVLDLHYAEEHWLGMDLLILARTVPTCVRGRGPRIAPDRREHGPARVT
ncbi:sugar transferase [Streptomyces albipurpureus]|uniref:Sugar transferase n=1 Tax=Streptomyces albipurpureus TaxID=2897419 RepID=A0ABT0URR4_9ACTN|nr:sugar transferase [Streptomyces sp. CWNU-1]MCM2391309.1 sugar transferase [Streptomyces sp. CWNU-1]